MTNERTVYIYAFDKVCRVIGYHFLKDCDVTIKDIIYWTNRLVSDNDETEVVTVVDSVPGLYRMFIDAKSNDPAKLVEFEDYCCVEGIITYGKY